MNADLDGLPPHPNDITAAWLESRLTASGTLHKGHLTAVSVDVGAVWNVAHTARLRIEYDGNANPDAPRSLFVKISNHVDPLADIFPGEFAFYSETPATGLPIAKCHGAYKDPGNGRTCVLLEDLTDTHVTTPWPDPPAMPTRLCRPALTGGTLMSQIEKRTDRVLCTSTSETALRCIDGERA